MKVLKQFMKTIGASRRNSTSSSPSKKKRRATITMGSTCTTEETSHTSLASVCSVEAPWRVEQIRVEAPGEADWWKEDTMEVTTDDTWVTNSSAESSDDGKKSDGGSTSSTKRFHNCGLETWEAARAAWTARPDPRTTKNNSSIRSQPPLSRKELAKIISKASSLRTCELPRSTPLKNMVESYQVVWNGDDM